MQPPLFDCCRCFWRLRRYRMLAPQPPHDLVHACPQVLIACVGARTQEERRRRIVYLSLYTYKPFGHDCWRRTGPASGTHALCR